MSAEHELGVSTDGDMPIEISMVTEVLSEPVDLPELKITDMQSNRCVCVCTGMCVCVCKSCSAWKLYFHSIVTIVRDMYRMSYQWYIILSLVIEMCPNDSVLYVSDYYCQA